MEYTAEEEANGIESVRTGLRDEDEESVEEDKDEEMQDVDSLGVTSANTDVGGAVAFGMSEIKKGLAEPGKNVKELASFAMKGRG